MKKILSYILVFVFLSSVLVSSVSAETLRERNERFKRAHAVAVEQYKKEVEFYKDARAELLKAREAFKNNRSTENREAFTENTREFVKRSITSLIKRLERVKDWVVNRNNLNDAQKESIISEVDKEIVWLNEKLAGVDTASAQELLDTAKEIRVYWKGHKVLVKRVIGHIEYARIYYVIEKLDSYYDRIDTKTAEFEAEGKDISAIKVLMDTLSSQIELAKEKYEKAKEIFDSIENAEDANRLFVEGHKYIKEAHAELIKAHKTIVEIIRSIKTLASSSDSSAETN